MIDLEAPASRSPGAAARSLRITMLSTPLVRAGGAERQFFEEAKALGSIGHDVCMLTFELRDEALFVDGLRRANIDVLSGGHRIASQVYELRKYLVRSAPDVLISHTSPELTWLATRMTGVPFVQYHNSPPFYIGGRANPYMRSSRYRRVFPRIRDGVAGYADLEEAARPSLRTRSEAELRTALKHRALRDAAAVIVPSRRTADELRLLHGIEATLVRGCLSEDAIASAAAHRRTREPVILSVCRLEPVKRVDLLIQAFELVLQRRSDARLVIAGTGSEAESLRALAVEVGVADRVTFTGYVPDEALPFLFASASVFAAPAMADFNIAPYEALAAGCNAVWTTEMETEPQIESSGAVFVAAPDVHRFADAIVAALAAPHHEIDLSSMTWSARGQRIDAILRHIAGVKAAA